MCHVILALPVLGISVFWILPFQLALPIYIVILIISAAMYRAIMKSMMTPVKTGSEGLIGMVGNFLGFNSEEGIVRVHGEIWNASSPENLKPGEEIRVVDVNGLHLLVEGINKRK
ncbi:MAG: NfeD family protein [Ignavibacteriaceae bacterium]